MTYLLYVNYECIEEFDNYEDARRAFYNAVDEDSEAVIDILSSDGEISYLGIN